MANKHGEFIWYELCAADADRAQQFYSEVLGWDIADSQTPGMDYRIVHAVDEESGERTPIGAVMPLSAEMTAAGARPVWLGYIAVDDVDSSVASITARGGSVHMPATDIPEVGRIAMVTDPQGVPFYLMRGIQEAPSEAFASECPRVGHCAWNELMTADPEGAKDFYFGEFGWTKDGEMPIGPLGVYEFIRHNGVIGAVMRKPEEAPGSLWNFYFRVKDIDAAIATVGACGGNILQGPDEIPGGDFTVLGLDPQGAPFALVGSRTT
ncbi:VOC family protein [Parahaliea aestuarii]|uniref:VOC family protein n=1 Tax=Parahaliea aestuarii TaxID=1852021 RepID=A0A5C9A0B0_9GAMM|nr:VOC family protein [Parahaliea aestuarii]TXS93499.1 VOC family protein [Parahaliea aestuarii]